MRVTLLVALVLPAAAPAQEAAPPTSPVMQRAWFDPGREAPDLRVWASMTSRFDWFAPLHEVGVEVRSVSPWLLRGAVESIWIVPDLSVLEPGIDPIPSTTVFNHLWLEAGGRWSIFELSAGAGMWFAFGALQVRPSLRLRAALGHPASARVEAAVSVANQMPLFVSAQAQVPVGDRVYLVAHWGLAGLSSGARIRFPIGEQALELSAMAVIAPFQVPPQTPVSVGVEYQW